VAQGYSEDPQSLILLIQRALNHRGFSVVNILSPCPTFNQPDGLPTDRPKVVHINATSHPVQDRLEALRLAMIENDPPRVGVFYQKNFGGVHEGQHDVEKEETRGDLTRLEEIMEELKP